MIIEPHIHMYSRTTDDYQAMYREGIRACVEPSFWMGCNRRHAGTFFDYFQLILEFESVRARRFGIDHYAAVALNPKEAEDPVLADEMIGGIEEYLDHPRCVALGEIGLNSITKNERAAFERQLAIAHRKDMPVIIHLPHENKEKGIEWTADIIRNEGIDVNKVLIDHNTEVCMKQARDTGCWTGMTVYPVSKLNPARVSALIREYGSERMIVDGSADWGVSDPLSLVKTARFMEQDGHSPESVEKILFDNPNRFYSASPNWKPEFGIRLMRIEEFQR